MEVLCYGYLDSENLPNLLLSPVALIHSNRSLGLTNTDNFPRPCYFESSHGAEPLR